MSSEKNKNVIITKAAREKLVKAGCCDKGGAIALPKIVGMAFGDGGADSEGNVLPPAEEQEGLLHELYRKVIDGYSFPTETSCKYECTLLEEELVGADISEVGLYDEDGDIVCVKTFRKKGKDDDVEQTYSLEDIF